jgi:Domain of Unknown Function (DUF349)
MGSEWGRIDADGTVWVRTVEGERAVGSWQAGDPEAGLAYYVRHYEDLATEIALLEQRLDSGAGDPQATKAAAVALKEQLQTVSAVGDLAALDARLDALVTAAESRAGARAAERERVRAEAVAAKERLTAEAEQIAESATSWKAAGDRLREIVEEWKQIKGVDRRTDDALWKRFAAARDAFGKRRGQHFAQLDAERGSAKVIKEGLVARAEELAQSSSWRDTAAAMRDLMSEWKAAPRAARDEEDKLWARFRAAQDSFFSRRSGVFAERDAEQIANQRAKEAVIAEAEALDVSDPKAAAAALRDLQSRFDDVGRVPRETMRALDERMRAAEQRVREAGEAQWRRAHVESNPFLAELRARLAEAEAKLERARHSGDRTRIEKAEREVAQRRSLLPH